MNAHCACPSCDAVLADKEIPVDSMHLYGGVEGEPMDCPYGCGQPRHFSRLIGVSDWDHIIAWRCPDCGKEWPR